jgi:hypothetical protein
LDARSFDSAGDVSPLESRHTEQLEQEAAPRPRIVPRWAAWVIIAAGLAMFPRLVLLSPEGTQIGGRSVAWIGFGLVLSALVVRTGWLALRGREHMELSAAAAGTLLVAAVWFQVIMSGARSEVELAAAFAVLAELPLAGVCLWIAGRAEFRRVERARIMIYLVQKLRRERAAESLIRSGTGAP